MRNKKVLIGCLIVVVITIVAVGYVVFLSRTSDNVKQQNGKTQVPDLISQLYSVSIPRDFDPKENVFVALKDGKVEVYGPQILGDGTADKNGPQDVFYWGAYLNTESNNYTIADFNSDGLDDVAIVIGETGGGSGYFYHLAIFINEAGHLKYLTSEYLGDRIKVNKISYFSGIITADIITQGPNEPFCCGTTPAILKFKLKSNHLVSVR